MKRVEWVLLFILVVATAFSVLDLFVYRDNPHCTQVISLRSAVMDFNAHEEERPAPLIYRKPFAVLLRAYFALVLVVFVLAPLLTTLAAIYLPGRAGQWKRLCMGSGSFFLLNVPIAAFLAGERFTGVYAHMLLWVLPLYLPFTWFDVRRSHTQG